MKNRFRTVIQGLTAAGMLLMLSSGGRADILGSFVPLGGSAMHYLDNGTQRATFTQDSQALFTFSNESGLAFLGPIAVDFHLEGMATGPLSPAKASATLVSQPVSISAFALTARAPVSYHGRQITNVLSGSFTGLLGAYLNPRSSFLVADTGRGDPVTLESGFFSLSGEKGVDWTVLPDTPNARSSDMDFATFNASLTGSFKAGRIAMMSDPHITSTPVPAAPVVALIGSGVWGLMTRRRRA